MRLRMSRNKLPSFVVIAVTLSSTTCLAQISDAAAPRSMKWVSKVERSARCLDRSERKKQHSFGDGDPEALVRTAISGSTLIPACANDHIGNREPEQQAPRQARADISQE